LYALPFSSAGRLTLVEPNTALSYQLRYGGCHRCGLEGV
jgi:hypothetical protein